MNVIRYLAWAAMAIVAPVATAQSPFEINGLHTDLVFADARAMAEKLGAKCRIKHSRTEGGGVSAQCELPTADASAPAGSGVPPDAPARGPTIGAQPITRIGMEAPDETAPLVRIVFIFDGNIETVAEYLTQQYGAPDYGGEPTTEKSWSHSRRRSWSQGMYTLGLSNSPDIVILTVIRPEPDPGVS